MDEEIVNAFLKIYGDDLVSLVLFGSYARGEQRKDSDIDLLVVLRKIDDRYEVFKKFFNVEKILDSTLYTKLREKGYDPYISPVFLDVNQATVFRPLYIDIVFDAKLLFDRDNTMKNTFERVRKKLDQLGAKRERLGRIYYVTLSNVKPGEVITYE
ncbi:nucleotidyltransferase domain-containing protein [Metallosphaera hakonensis]|uniref:Nucleotidyltransferase domain-containing protein n=1 Tax=Metallosphaera hakonensis JCM 8857 = DSM 7519 TaxID=1293036 RepID=A0A2U9IT93_9CREN|nr:nucleotidyltransferase domain-containing protein [Metallosphaera hakonensis]AWR99183.1 nucleotidyltransferase domain-containing protein [Metallosphaera hakonensis JCM 8857 = DSM 7519]